MQQTINPCVILYHGCGEAMHPHGGERRAGDEEGSRAGKGREVTVGHTSWLQSLGPVSCVLCPWLLSPAASGV